MGKCAALDDSTRIHSLLGQQPFLKGTASEKASKVLLIGMEFIYIYIYIKPPTDVFQSIYGLVCSKLTSGWKS